jgi:hypothetical protein
LSRETQKAPSLAPDAAPSTIPPVSPLDPDLARVVMAWPDLAEPIRRAVLALVGSAVEAATE